MTGPFPIQSYDIVQRTMRDIKSKLKAKMSYFLLKKPLPYIVLGKSRSLLNLARKEMQKLLHKNHSLKIKKNQFCLHEFNPSGTKKALVVHGWMSESTHMMMHIKFLVEQGYQVFAIDFPAHGKSKGSFLTWRDAIHCLLHTQDVFGAFDVIVGHSYGGGMVVNASGVAELFDEFEKRLIAKKYILLSSSLDISVPIRLFSKLARLNEKEKALFKEMIIEDADIEIEKMSGKYLLSNHPIDAEFLVIHGDKDYVVKPEVSRNFSQLGEHVTLIEKKDLGHMDMLFDESLLEDIKDFLED